LELSRKLKKARKKLAITQEQFAEYIGVSVKTISNWENNKHPVSLENYIKLSKALQVSLDYLMKDETDNNLENERQMYTTLGRQLARVVDFQTADAFWMNYAICEKETTLLLPIASASKFVSLLQKELSKFNGSNIKNFQEINTLSQNFLFKWHKFNRGNLLLSKSTKVELLITLERIFTNFSDTISTEDVLFPQQPLLLLRNLLFSSIKVSNDAIRNSEKHLSEEAQKDICEGEYQLLNDPDDDFKIKTKYK